jgi:hypothetical protein
MRPVTVHHVVDGMISCGQYELGDRVVPSPSSSASSPGSATCEECRFPSVEQPAAYGVTHFVMFDGEISCLTYQRGDRVSWSPEGVTCGECRVGLMIRATKPDLRRPT